MHYYQFHVGDYLSHTSRLSLLEDLCYRRLLDLYYQTEGPIPLDLDRVARLIGFREHPQVVSDVLSDFFLKSEEGYKNKRCDEEISAYHAKAERARNANKKRWGSDEDLKLDADQIRNDSEVVSQPLTINHKPITSSNEEVEAIKKSPPPAKEKSRKGTKLPLDFRIPSDWQMEAQNHMRCSINSVNADCDAFIHYYTNGKGKNESCIDWLMTWRNWYRKPYSSCSKEAEAKPNATHQKTDNSVPAKIERAIAERNARRQAEGAGPSPGTVIDGQFERIPF